MILVTVSVEVPELVIVRLRVGDDPRATSPKARLPERLIIRVPLVGSPTIVAPRKPRTSSIGFAAALVLLPAKSRPIARGLVATSSTTSEPESPLSSKVCETFAKMTWPVNVLLNAKEPWHSPSYVTVIVAFNPST